MKDRFSKKELVDLEMFKRANEPLQNRAKGRRFHPNDQDRPGDIFKIKTVQEEIMIGAYKKSLHILKQEFEFTPEQLSSFTAHFFGKG